MKKKSKALISIFVLFTFVFLNIPLNTIVKAETTKRVNFALKGSATASNVEPGTESF
ncbi:MAG: hypothetical protein HUJ77_00005, partial [Clostridium sp.]|nr:hypothetical protein [Clostridium sp.]